MTKYEQFLNDHDMMEEGHIKYPSWIKYRHVGLDAVNRVVRWHRGKRRAIRTYSHGILTESMIEGLRKYGPFLEVGSGTGYWASEFKQRDIDIIATDPFPCNRRYFRVEKGLYGDLPVECYESP